MFKLNLSFLLQNVKIKKVPKVDIIYDNISNKTTFTSPLLGCIPNETMTGESMAHKVIRKVNTMLKFLHQKNKYLTPNLRCLLCNTLSQLHF